ncbi:uncharacterized protein LOC124887790 [Capsicum annuum]|uniref:uncharacterized protein LOC124887790 n=1 Tax=Capsicum annuum TaxID=4072 RepID=UPI001FB0C117|nr:uncharacterized protein LOC124887790 [Capsicum annuum]
MTTRIRKVKFSLEKMVMDDEWKNYKGDKGIGAKTRAVKFFIMNDEKWDNIDYFWKFTEPIVDMLRDADLDGPKLHLIYDMWDSIIEKDKKIIFEHEGENLISGQSNFFNSIHGVLVARWNKKNTPLHCMTHSLVPKYYHQSWLQGENEIQRVAPNEDLEIASNRIKCFQRYFDSNQMTQVSLEYGKFCTMGDYFGEPHVIDIMEYEDLLSWWENHGVSTPLLQQLAYKLLTQPASSSCCERNWSTYSMIHNIKRNKLATSRVEDLVFVHYNLRLLSRKKEKYINGPSKYWDVGGDQFEVEDTINNLTELSIDEPQLEGVFFDEEFEDLEEVEEDAEE